MVGRYETQEYAIPVAGRTLRLLGPKRPHSVRDDPKVQERFKQDGYAPWWATPWPGAVMLAEHVIACVEPGPEPVLELGAGLGLAGIALARAGHRMAITDYDEDALEFVRASARLNEVTLHEVKLLDWRHPPAERYTMIVGGDCLYDKRSHDAIAKLIATRLKPGGQAFVADQKRDGAEAFHIALHKAALAYEKVEAKCKAIPRPDAIDGRVFRGTVYRIGHEKPARDEMPP